MANVGGVGGAGAAGALPTSLSRPGGVQGKDSDVNFGETLAAAFEQASTAEQVADDHAKRFAAGDPEIGIHEAVIAAEKANVSVRFAVSLKNKLLDAYRELMSTQV